MFSRFLLVVIFIFGEAHCNSTLFTRLPEVMWYLCPGSNICGKMYEIPNMPDFEGTCCTACSCEPNCEIKRNCCFPSQLPYTHDNTDLNWLPHYKRECIYPIAIEQDKKQRLRYQSYCMITSVPNSLSCGDTKIAPWGSLYPVYSDSKKQIYKNMACAYADGITDFLLWDVLLNCFFNPNPFDENFSFFDLHTLAKVEQIFEHNAHLTDHNCYVSFMIEGKNLDTLKCYKDVVADCPESELFQVPDNINISTREVIDACSSGPLSPYRKEELYANVFCFICNLQRYNQDNTCVKVSPLNSIDVGSGKANFFGIINSNVLLNKDFGDKPTRMPRMTLACDNNKQNKAHVECRPIYCPLRQFPDRLGNCKHTTTRVLVQPFVVTVNVTIYMYLNVTDIIRRNTIGALISPWSKDWKIMSVKQIELPIEINSTHLTVLLKKDFQNMSTSTLMKNIGRNVQRGWILKNGEKSYIFQSKLPTWDYAFAPVFENIYSDLILIENRTLHLSLPRYSVAFEDFYSYGIRTIPQMISRLYYCKLVELSASEYIMSKNKTALFNIRTQRVMFVIHSFIMIEGPTIVDQHVKICIEDSGLSEPSHASVLSTTLHEVLSIFLTVINIFW